MDNSLIPNIELFIAEVSPFNHLPKPLISQIANNIQIRYVPKRRDCCFNANPAGFFIYCAYRRSGAN